MLIEINQRLVLASLGGADAVGLSREFQVPFPDNVAEFEIVIVAVVGSTPMLTAVLEATNDHQNWTGVEFIGPFPPSPGLLEAPTITLDTRAYRVRWIFNVAPGGDGSCILAAKVNTCHA